MPDPLIEELALDLTPALEGLGPLDEALKQISANFSASFADQVTQTIAALQLPDIDVAPLTASIEGAITEGTAAPALIEGDVSPVAAALADLTGTPELVGVDADTTAAKDAIDALAGTPIDLEVDANTSAAQDQIDQLGGKVHSAGGEVAGFEGAIVGAKVASGLAAGEVGALGEAAHFAGGSAVGAVAGISALAAFVGETVKVAADAEAQNKRFAESFGPLRDAVEHINIGGLNTTIDELGKKSGTPLANLQAVASRVAALGHSAGAADPEIVATTQRILALGAQVSVTNPRLGDASDVADRLTNAFARGGRALAPFGIALTSAEINARALADTGKTAAADLTIFEKAAAGSALQAEKLGGSLGTSFEAGAKNAQVQLRAIKTQIEETLIGIGTPLLAPVVALSKAIVPLAAGIGGVLGSAIGAALPLIVPVVTELAHLVEVIGVPLAAALGRLGPSFTDVGRAAGDILVSLSPVVTLLAQALVPAAQVLTPLLDGTAAVLQLVADVLGIIPAPLLDVAVGLGVLALAWRNWLFVAATTSDVIDLALGPIGLVLIALTAVGVGLSLFGGHSRTAAVDAKALGDAIFGSTKSADELNTKLVALSDSLTKYEQSQLAATAEGSAGLDILNRLGKGYGDVAKAVGGTDTQYKQFTTSLLATVESQDRAAAASAKHGEVVLLSAEFVRRFIAVLDAQRRALQDNATGQLTTLVATKALTQAEVDAAEKRATGKDGLVDYVSALKDATAIAEKHAAAVRAQRDASGQTADAFGQLRAEVIAGTTTSDNFAAAATRLGLTSKETEAFVKDLTDSMKKFVDEGTSRLPGASIPIANFQHAIETAMQGAAAATDSGTKGVDTAQKRLVDVSRQNADALAAAQQQLAQASAAQGAAPSDANAKAIDTAQKNVESVLAKGGQNLADARKQVTDAQTAGASELAKSRAALLAATDPEQVVRQTFEEAAAIATFQTNITTLIQAGFTQVAQSLIAQGPQTGALLAQSLVDQPAVAKQLNDVQGLLSSATNQYRVFLEDQAPTLAAGAAVAGTAVTTGFNSAVHLDAGAVRGLAAGLVGGAGAPSTLAAATTAGQTTSAAYSAGLDLHTPAQTETQAAAAAITNSTVVATANSVGISAAAAFGDGFDLTSGVASAFGRLEAIIRTQAVTVAPAVEAAGNAFGRTIGTAIAHGIIVGVDAGLPAVQGAGERIFGAAETGAKTKGKISSPSEVFADLGRDVVAGFALGLADRRAVTDQAGRLVAAVSSPFASLALPKGFAAATAAGLPTAPTVDPALAAAANAHTAPHVVVQGPLVGQVVNEQTAQQVAAELAWTYSP